MRIVTDNAVDLPLEIIEKYNIHIMPINVMFGSEEYLSGVNLDHPQAMTSDQFYAKTSSITDANWPKTSQPTPFQYVEAYEKMIAEGESEFITITVGEKLSGTYASAVMAHKELEGKATFHLVDSAAGSIAMGFQVSEAARLAAEGVDVDTILKRVDDIKNQTVTCFMIDNLEYAVKGGRVSAWRSTVASLLKIKPIMTLKDGLVVEDSKVRSKKKALNAIIDFAKTRVGDRPVKMGVACAGNSQNGQELLELASQSFNVVDTQILNMAIAIAINMGPGALGLFVVPMD